MYILRNACLPVVTMAGVLYGLLLGGAALVEVVFAWGGLGQYAVQSMVQNVPSLITNEGAFAVDTAELTYSVKLRGLSPNDALVLVNGKRRHTTANLAVAGGLTHTGRVQAAEVGRIISGVCKPD